MLKAGLIAWVDRKNTAKEKNRVSEDRTMRIINAFPAIDDPTIKEEKNVAIWNLY